MWRGAALSVLFSEGLRCLMKTDSRRRRLSSVLPRPMIWNDSGVIWCEQSWECSRMLEKSGLVRVFPVRCDMPMCSQIRSCRALSVHPT